jgi:hypothetical protein
MVFSLLLQGLDHYSGTFLFCNSFIFLLCASVVPLGHYVGAEAGSNWCLIDINIFSLSKKDDRIPISASRVVRRCAVDRTARKKK